jgi:hypothetical protein
MVSIPKGSISRVLKIGAQLADLKSNRSASAVQDACKRVLFVTENSRNVNRILKEFHDSRILNGRKDRANRIAFVSNMATERAKHLQQANTIHKEMLQDTDNESAEFIAEMPVSPAASVIEAMQDSADAPTPIKESSPHFDGVDTSSEVARKKSEPTIDAGVVTKEVHAGLLKTAKTIAPVTPKAAAPVTPKAAAPVTSKAAAPVTSKAAALVTSKAAAPVTSKASAAITPEATASVTPKVGTAATSKSVKSKRNRR